MKHLPLLTLLLSSLVHAAAPGDLVEGKWVQISQSSGTGSTIRSVWPNTGSAAVKDVKNVMAYSGGAFASSLGSLGSLLVWGGGHADYAGNEVYAFDVSSGRWSVIGSPSPTSVCNYATSLYADGKPCSAHTYGGGEYAPTTQEFFKIGPSSDYSVGGGGTGNIDAFSTQTNTWRRAGRLATFQDQCSTGSGEAAVTAWDSVNQVIWWHGVLSKYGGAGEGGACGSAGGVRANILQKINPTTGATIASYLGANIGIDGEMAFAPELKALVQLDSRSNDNLNVWDVTTGTPVFYPDVAYSGTMPASTAGFDWDPIAQKGVIYTGAGSTVTTLTPPVNWATTHTGTWVFANVTAGSGSAVPTQTAPYTWTFGRFRYAPALCGFVNASGVDLPVYAYRLTGGAGSGCGGSPPADPLPAVVFSASPLSINTGQSSTLTWSSSNTANCYIGIGQVALSGTQVVAPTSTTTYTIACGGLASQSAQTATATATVTVQQQTGSSDFTTRCAALGVVRCTSFDTSADFTQEVEIFSSANNLYPTLDTSVKSSGTGSMRFDIPATVDANVAGYWLQTMWDETYVHPVSGLVGGVDTNHFGPGETFYMQYRQRMDANFHNTDWYSVTSGGYPKQWIMHNPGSSCTTLQFVAVERYDTDIPQMYGSCGSASMYVNLPDGDDLVQQGPDVDCRRRASGPTCKKYAADTWMTFYYKYTLGAFGSPTTHVEAWLGYDGEAPTQYIDIPDFVLDYSSSSSERLAMLQLTPYMTGRNPAAVLPISKTWYDDLIVSTQPIAWPAGGSAFPLPTVTINASPTSLASGLASQLSWTTTDATACTATGGWSGTKGASGSESTGALTASQTFTLTCTGSGGTAVGSTAVTVAAAPPTVSLSATPSSILTGSASVLTWSTTGAITCAAYGGWSGAKATSGTFTTNALTATTTFGLDCIGTGGTGSGTTTVTVTTPQPVVDLTSSLASVDYGSEALLTFSSTYANTCAFTQGLTGSTPTSGTRATGSLLQTTTFGWACLNAAGYKEDTVVVNVVPVPNVTVSLTASAPTITSGDSVDLSWTVTNTATACTGTGGTFAGARTFNTGANGPISVSPTVTTSYSVYCVNGVSSEAASVVQVIVNAETPAPVVLFTAVPAQVTSGSASLLSWLSSDATSCTGVGGTFAGARPTEGDFATGNLTATTAYTLNCSGAGGTGSASKTVTVTAAPINPAAEITVTPASIPNGGEGTVTWSCTNSTTAVASDGAGEWSGSLELSGTRGTGVLTADTTFTVTCSDGVTPDAASAVADVEAVAKTVTLGASPNPVVSGSASTLTWSTTGTLDLCSLGLADVYTPKPTSGTASTGAMTSGRTYTLVCIDFANGDYTGVSQSVTIGVTAAPGANQPSRRRWRPWWRR